MTECETLLTEQNRLLSERVELLERKTKIADELMGLLKQRAVRAEERLHNVSLRCECAEETCYAIGKIVGWTQDDSKFGGEELERLVQELKERASMDRFHLTMRS